LTQSQDPSFFSICDKVVLAVWSVPTPIEGQSSISGSFGEPVSPLSSLRLADDKGGTRLIFAFPRPHEDSATFMVTAGGLSATAAEYRLGGAPAVTQAIFDGLSAQARMSLAAALITTWPSLFHLQRNKGYIATLRNLLKPSTGAPGGSRP
jgi:hypothetical protein